MGTWKKGYRINKDHAYDYAMHVLKGPFPEGEKIIGERDVMNFWGNIAFKYARDILKGPFPAGEEAIAMTLWTSINYAKDILKAPFPLGEPKIATNSSRSLEYVAYFWGKGLFPEALALKHHTFLKKYGQA